MAHISDISIQIQDKTYADLAGGKDYCAIKDFNLALQAHEFVCLFGHSGCGKTSLLNCIAGLDTNFVGNISLNNTNTVPKISYIFQNPRLLPWRTVRENIELVLDNVQDITLVDNLLNLMQLEDKQHLYPQHLSGGMSRRVAIIRAFVTNPDILLMDEPFASLDLRTARQVRKLLMQLWQNRPHTVLFVTHDLREAIALADRLVFLSQPPMQVICEVLVPIARDSRDDTSQIEIFRQQLIDNHPELNALL